MPNWPVLRCCNMAAVSSPRGGKVTPYEAGPRNRTVVIEFDSYEQAIAARESDEYAAALERLEGAVVRDFRVLEGA